MVSNSTPRIERAIIEPAQRARAAVRRHFAHDDGAVTAEYAIATIAAVGFAALLVVVLRSDEVRGLLLGLIRHALALPA